MLLGFISYINKLKKFEIVDHKTNIPKNVTKWENHTNKIKINKTKAIFLYAPNAIYQIIRSNEGNKITHNC